jgi:cobalt-zinc-cadmium efflux system outer membrane protein
MPWPVAEPAGQLTLRDALAAALMSSPELAPFSWEVRAREADALQAGLRPNPEFDAELENFAGSGDLGGFGASETTLFLSQLLELGGKRSKRLRVAELDRDLAAWDYETARIDVLTEVTKAFTALLAAQEQHALAEDLVRVAQDVLESVTERVKAGATSPVEESRARVELETSRVDLDRTARALTVARKRLAATWGSVAPQFSDAAGALETTPPTPTLDELLTRIEQNPDLARWVTELDQRQAALALEKTRRIPNLALGAGVRHFAESDDNALVVGLSVPFPIFDRNQGAARAQAFRVERAKEQRRAALVRIQTQLAAAHEELRASRSESLALKNHVLPQADIAFLTAQDAYRSGRMNFTDVLDTRRTLFELRARYFRSLAEYQAAKADIERLIGEHIGHTTSENGRP